jgi:tRNA (uracil-5-)-methyltransferase
MFSSPPPSTHVLTVYRRNIWSYKKGVSLVLRDSLPVPVPTGTPSGSALADATLATDADDNALHVAITNHRGTVRERAAGLLFEYPCHSFFQNNNAVLGPLTGYVRDALAGTGAGLTHLVDAYCGAGLFALTLAGAFERVAGIELSAESIRAATRNAELNADVIPPGRCTFRAGDAADIFGAVPDFPPERTALVIDPPRKGTDARFLAQLVAFAPAAVVYVSCNVHTQARDLGMLTRLMRERGRGQYVIESVRGFDLFPQTAHVESVAVLRLVGEEQ